MIHHLYQPPVVLVYHSPSLQGDLKDKGRHSIGSEQPRHKGPIEPIVLLALLRLGRLAREEIGLLAVDDVLAGPEVSLVRVDALAARDELVAEDEDQVERDAQVGGDEVLVVEVAPLGVVREHVEVLGQRDDDAEDQGAPRPVHAQRRLERQRRVGHLLRLTGPHEVDVRHEDRDPGEQAEDGDQVDEVAEDGLGVVGDVHVGQQGEEGGHAESVDGDAPSVGP